MAELYHTFNAANRDVIQQSGLEGLDWLAKFDAWDLPRSPAAVEMTRARREPAGPPTRTRKIVRSSPRSVARAIVERVFEDERPPDCQSRNGAVFFHPTREPAGPNWAHEAVVVVDSDRVDARFSVAETDAKTTVMNEAVKTVRGVSDVETDERAVRDAAQEYWASVEPWTPGAVPDGSVEVFTAGRVPPTAITSITTDPP